MPQLQVVTITMVQYLARLRYGQYVQEVVCTSSKHMRISNRTHYVARIQHYSTVHTQPMAQMYTTLLSAKYVSTSSNAPSFCCEVSCVVQAKHERQVCVP
jgi:hypothetical protein